MDNVVNLAEVREERMPHTSGIAKCLACKHEWVAVSPFINGYVMWLECPACGLVRGKYKFQHERNGEHWACNCGNDLFHLSRNGVYCPNCGSWQYGWEE